MQRPSYKGWELVKDRKTNPEKWYCWSPPSKDGIRRRVYLGTQKRAIDAFYAMVNYVDMRGLGDGK